MKGFYDYMEEDPIAKIEYSKGLYNDQVHKVEKEEYIKNLLLADYVKQIKSHRSRYDLIDIFPDAQKQIGNKLKKERQQLEVVQSFIREDFFNNNSSFKIVRIMSGGYEGYYWSVELSGYGQTVVIEIPVMKHINTENFHHAHNGMFAFGIRDSEYSMSIKKTSYKIEDIAEYIKSYFGLDEVNNDDY